MPTAQAATRGIKAPASAPRRQAQALASTPAATAAETIPAQARCCGQIWWVTTGATRAATKRNTQWSWRIRRATVVRAAGSRAARVMRTHSVPIKSATAGRQGR